MGKAGIAALGPRGAATAHQNINQYIDALTMRGLRTRAMICSAKHQRGYRRAANDAHRGARARAYRLLAGLDTVAALLGWTARYLAENPAARRRILEEPRIIPRVIEEMLRRYSVANIARVVREDMEYRGVQMRAGEQITCRLASRHR